MTNPQLDTHVIYRRALDVAGPKHVAHALGLSLGHVYRCARDPMDVDGEGTGARNDLDRLQALAELLATRPGGAAVLVQMREWTDALFDRLLGQSTQHSPVSMADMGDLAREYAEFAQNVNAEPSVVNKEGAELIAKTVDIMRRRGAATLRAS